MSKITIERGNYKATFIIDNTGFEIKFTPKNAAPSKDTLVVFYIVQLLLNDIKALTSFEK